MKEGDIITIKQQPMHDIEVEKSVYTTVIIRKADKSKQNEVWVYKSAIPDLIAALEKAMK